MTAVSAGNAVDSGNHLPGLGLVVGAGAGLVVSGWVLVGTVGPTTAICTGAALGLVAGAGARLLLGPHGPARRTGG